VLGSYPQDANGGSIGVHYDVAAILTTLFMAFAVGYWATRSNIVPNTGDLSKSELVQIFLVTAFGLVTLFVPLARTNIPVAGRTEWSGLAIVLWRDAWKFPPSPVVLDITASYTLMLFAAVAAFFPRPKKVLLVISLLGVICSSWALEMGHSLLFDWFIRTGGILRKVDVTLAPGMYSLVITMSTLLIVSTNLSQVPDFG
jgi:hypothetical protein